MTITQAGLTGGWRDHMTLNKKQLQPSMLTMVCQETSADVNDMTTQRNTKPETLSDMMDVTNINQA